MFSVPDPDVEMVFVILSLFIEILQNGPQLYPLNRFSSNSLIFFLHTNIMKMITPCKAFTIVLGYQTTGGTMINHDINSIIQLIPITMNSFRYIKNLWAKYIFYCISVTINKLYIRYFLKVLIYIFDYHFHI